VEEECEAGLAARTQLITGPAQGTMGKPALEKTAVGYCNGTTTLRGDQGAFTVGREERNCGVCGHTQYKEESAQSAGARAPSVIGPNCPNCV
jgi:hypothetical protein